VCGWQVRSLNSHYYPNVTPNLYLPIGYHQTRSLDNIGRFQQIIEKYHINKIVYRVNLHFYRFSINIQTSLL